MSKDERLALHFKGSAEAGWADSRSPWIRGADSGGMDQTFLELLYARYTETEDKQTPGVSSWMYRAVGDPKYKGANTIPTLPKWKLKKCGAVHGLLQLVVSLKQCIYADREFLRRPRRCVRKQFLILRGLGWSSKTHFSPQTECRMLSVLMQATPDLPEAFGYMSRAGLQSQQS